MTDRQIEMLWRCSSCGHRNLGRHLLCQGCKNPKDGTEQYEMPEDTAGAATVSDPALLKVALAGSNWRCSFCESDQRAFDGRCARCGAEQADADRSDHAAAPPASRAQPVLRPPALSMAPLLAVATAAGVLLLASLALVLSRPHHPELPAAMEAEVTSVSWSRTLRVQRLRPVHREGFVEQRPVEAQDVQSLGPHLHHTEQVPDGFRTESYTVDEPDGFRDEPYQQDVPDGYRTESYSERVACGETCTPTPQSCKETCTSNRNGFASCKTTCTGGNRSCTTKYCDQPRTRQVAQTKRVTLTRQVPKTKVVSKTRQVPAFRAEPRYAEWFGWTAPEWVAEDDRVQRGTDAHPTWPDDPPDAGVPTRSSRAEECQVAMEGGSYPGLPHAFTYTPPSTDALAAFSPGSRHWLWVTGFGVFELLAGPPEQGGLALVKSPK